MTVQLLLPLLSSENYMLGICDDYDISVIKMRSISHLVLALQSMPSSCEASMVPGTVAAYSTDQLSTTFC